MKISDFSKPIKTKVSRYMEFYKNPEPGQLLITIPPYTFEAPARPDAQVKKLSDWKPFDDAEAMAEEDVANARFYTQYTVDVECDYIPNFNPAYGIGLCSSFFSNAEVIPGDDTTWVHPVLESLDEPLTKANGEILQFDSSNPWMDFMRRYMRRAAELCDGDYCITLFNAMAPSDLANALRGNELFYDLYDDPEGVHRLLDACVDATVNVYEELNPLTITPEDNASVSETKTALNNILQGAFVAGGMWIPGGGLFLSEDCADLCSPDAYSEFFGPATQKLLDRVGGAYIHHHAKGWQINPLIAELNKLRFLEFSWDPNCPRPVDHLDEMIEISLKVPMQIRCTLKDLRKYLPQMKEGRFSVMVNVDTLDEAKEAVKLVRKASIL